MIVANAAVNAEANALAALCNNGAIKIYSGTQPASPDTALSGNTLLATLTFGATAFGAAVAGVLTANAISSGVAAATGTATFARIYESDGATPLADITVGTSGADLNLSTISIVAGATVSVSSCTWTIPKHA